MDKESRDQSLSVLQFDQVTFQFFNQMKAVLYPRLNVGIRLYDVEFTNYVFFFLWGPFKVGSRFLFCFFSLFNKKNIAYFLLNGMLGSDRNPPFEIMWIQTA